MNLVLPREEEEVVVVGARQLLLAVAAVLEEAFRFGLPYHPVHFPLLLYLSLPLLVSVQSRDRAAPRPLPTVQYSRYRPHRRLRSS